MRHAIAPPLQVENHVPPDVARVPAPGMKGSAQAVHLAWSRQDDARVAAAVGPPERDLAGSDPAPAIEQRRLDLCRHRGAVDPYRAVDEDLEAIRLARADALAVAGNGAVAGSGATKGGRRRPGTPRPLRAPTAKRGCGSSGRARLRQGREGGSARVDLVEPEARREVVRAGALQHAYASSSGRSGVGPSLPAWLSWAWMSSTVARRSSTVPSIQSPHWASAATDPPIGLPTPFTSPALSAWSVTAAQPSAAVASSSGTAAMTLPTLAPPRHRADRGEPPAQLSRLIAVPEPPRRASVPASLERRHGGCPARAAS